ncbi:ribosome silencing factor [Epidermidibacterium keratini]|uniref:Ribosomal silencing factor RsfS n=1 Tax=Epidermidibacterium keratini TaxID=1891644 RepID=A0A7L4YKK4_9ACTN|nr:ribosome silencing factor [Epidermidibacterium keratini]QHB99348.1 ribosome silencing factor [Epidermidibacterium keratini]
MAATEHSLELAQVAAQAAADKRGEDITIIDVSEQLVITDCFVVVTATNDRQVGAIKDAVEEAMLRVGVKPVRREGAKEGRWVLLDFVDIVVHIQHTDERNFYDLARLWRDCPQIPFVDAAVPQQGDAEGSE